MGTNDDNDPFSSLFADALKAVEKVTEKPPEMNAPVEDLEFEIEIVEEYSTDNPEDEIEIDFDLSLEDDAAAQLEMRLLEKEEECQHLETNLKKALRGLKKRKKENETLTLRSELLQKELGRLRVGNQQAARQLEIVESRVSSSREALDAANQRIDQLNKALEKQQYQLDRNHKLRQKEVSEAKKFGIAPAILQFIPCIDNLELALQHAEADPTSLLEGLKISLNQFVNALSQLGIDKVDSNLGTEFNPEFHEAVMRIPHAEIAPNHIVESFSEGYILNGRLLRAAKVSVATPPLPSKKKSPEINEEEPVTVPSTEEISSDSEE